MATHPDVSLLDDRLDALFASDPVSISDPYPVYRELTELGGVYRHRSSVLLTKHADLKRLFRSDHSHLSARSFVEGTRAQEVMARMTDEQRSAYLELAQFEGLYVSRSDREMHDRLRRIAHRAFTPARIAELSDSVDRYTDQILTQVADEADCDLMVFAYQLPLMIIGDLLGVPQVDREMIRTWSKDLGRNRNGTDPVALMGAHAAMLQFRDYVQAMIEAQRGKPPSSDLVGTLLGAEKEDRLSDLELAAMFVVLLFAGHETTTNLIGLGLLELLRHDQWAAFRDRPELFENAIEELLRFVTPVQWLGRVAIEEIEFGDVTIEPGTTIVPLVAAANRDPDVFERPDELDISRPDATKHIALGFGTHFCLGASLARLEGKAALRGLAERFPNVELSVRPSELRWTGNAVFRTVERLPVSLGR